MLNNDLISGSSSVAAAEANETAGMAYVDWAAILAGAILAAAIFSLMTTFGAAVGLSVVSPLPGKGMSSAGLAVATGLWVVWITVSSFMVGAYVTGRLRRRIHDASAHESDVRDGAHGLIVWALGTVMIAWLTTSAAVGLTKAAGSIAATAASSIVSGAEMLGPTVERLVRSTSASTPVTDAQKTEIVHILSASAVSGTINADDKAYLSGQIATRAGIPAAEADKRITEAMAQVSAAAEQAKQAAESARRTGVLIAFLTAASIAIGAAAAWWAATMGGNHRDQGVDLGHLTSWR